MTATRRRTVEAAFAVIQHRGRVFIQRRAPGGFLGGYWEFPGGKRERGESWLACVRREVWEELGVRITGVTPLMTVRHDYRDRRLHGRVFRCRLAPKASALRASPERRWVYPIELQRVKLPPASRPIVDWLRRSAALSRRRPHAIIVGGQGGPS